MILFRAFTPDYAGYIYRLARKSRSVYSGNDSETNYLGFGIYTHTNFIFKFKPRFYIHVVKYSNSVCSNNK
jgi:hypothetical protein